MEPARQELLPSTSEATELVADLAAGQAMADMAAIGLCQTWAVRDAHVVAEELQHALKSRVAIELAKGMLAQRAAMGTDQAFACLRSYARTTKRLLVEWPARWCPGHSVPTWSCRTRVAGKKL